MPQPKKIKKKGAPPPPPPASLRRYDELLEIQQKGSENKASRVTISLAAAISDAEREVTVALEDAGILEHRAILTGRVEDADAYSESLVRLDAAYAELWAREALGRRIRIEEVNESRDRVIADAKDRDLSIPREHPRPLESRMELRRNLSALSHPPEASVLVSGIREIGPGAKDVAIGSDADLVLRRRLSQVAKASDGPTTVKVLAKKKK